MKRGAFVALLCLGVTLLVTSPVFADDTPLPPPSAVSQKTQGNDIPVLDDRDEQVMDEKQQEISNMVLASAEWIDSFFDDGRYIDDNNETRATLKFSVGYSSKDDLEIKPRFDIRLALPRLENRASIIISGGDDSDFDIEDNAILNPGQDERDPSAGLRFFMVDLKNFNFSWDGGVSWDYVYGGARIRYQHKIGDAWQGRLTNRTRWYSDTLWENTAAYDIETNIFQDLLFRSTTSANLYQESPGLYHSQNFRLFKVLNKFSVVSLDTGIYMNTKPSYKMLDLLIKARYRQRFFRDWLVLEVSPRCNWPEEWDYKFNPGIVFQLEATFGYKTDASVYKKIFNP